MILRCYGRVRVQNIHIALTELAPKRPDSDVDSEKLWIMKILARKKVLREA